MATPEQNPPAKTPIVFEMANGGRLFESETECGSRCYVQMGGNHIKNYGTGRISLGLSAWRVAENEHVPPCQQTIAEFWRLKNLIEAADDLLSLAEDVREYINSTYFRTAIGAADLAKRADLLIAKAKGGAA